jgi:hypothetical protein
MIIRLRLVSVAGLKNLVDPMLFKSLLQLGVDGANLDSRRLHRKA